MKNKILIFVLIIIVMLTGCKNTKKEQKTNNNQVNISARKKQIIKIFKKSLKEKKYIDNDNLKKFEVKRIIFDGYYKTNPNNKYMQIDFIFTCKDESNNCVKTLNSISDYGYYTMWINTDENTVYDIMSGISISFNEMENKDYIRVSEEIN